MQPAGRTGAFSLALRVTAGVGVALGLLLASAGTWRWPEAWIYAGVQFAMSMATAFWLRRHDPALLRERLALYKPSAPLWDRVFIGLTTVLSCLLSIVAGLGFRSGRPRLPAPFEAAGFVLVLLALALTWRVMAENTFLSRWVEIQRGQRVVSTGPYRVVRHPFYAAAVMLLAGVPLALGSAAALVPAAAVVALLVGRLLREERLLRKELPGYDDYVRRVPYRLVPGLW